MSLQEAAPVIEHPPTPPLNHSVKPPDSEEKPSSITTTATTTVAAGSETEPPAPATPKEPTGPSPATTPTTTDPPVTPLTRDSPAQVPPTVAAPHPRLSEAKKEGPSPVQEPPQRQLVHSLTCNPERTSHMLTLCTLRAPQPLLSLLMHR